MALTDEEQALLRFEAVRWNHEALKEAAIREQFDMPSTRYYQRLNRLIDSEDAYVFDAPLVKRLRRLRAQRRHARSVRRMAG